MGEYGGGVGEYKGGDGEYGGWDGEQMSSSLMITGSLSDSTLIIGLVNVDEHYIYIYIYRTLTPNIKGTDCSIFCHIAHFFDNILFYIFRMLFITLENNTLTSDLVQEC